MSPIPPRCSTVAPRCAINSDCVCHRTAFLLSVRGPAIASLNKAGGRVVEGGGLDKRGRGGGGASGVFVGWSVGGWMRE